MARRCARMRSSRLRGSVSAVDNSCSRIGFAVDDECLRDRRFRLHRRAADRAAARRGPRRARAEKAVGDASGEGFETVVVRPRFVWGRGDTTLLPVLVDSVKSGQFRWIGGGRHKTSTTHVDNTVEGLWLGATRGQPGGVYFV